MRLTIAQFTFDLQLAGQQRVVADLAKAFHKEGHRSLVCTTQFGGELVAELESSNVPFHCLGLKKSYAPRALIPVMRYLRDNKVDVVITHGNSGCLIPRIAAATLRIPVFLHVEHSLSSNYKKVYHIIINKVLSLFTDRIICVSQSAKQSLLEVEGTNTRKIAVIPNGLDTERFTVLKTEHIQKSDIRRIGIVGRFSEEKGHYYFVEAAAKLIKSRENVEFVFIGDGPLRSSIEQKVRDHGLSKYSRFLGVRSDVGSLLQTLDVFVLPSLREGLPISLLEAQYFGVPSVATEVGGNAEIIKNGYNGLLVPPRDPDALAKAILKVLNDSELGKELSARGREVFSRKYSGERMAKTYLDLIQTILCSRRDAATNQGCF